MGVREKGVFARGLQPKSVWYLGEIFLAKIPVINTCFPLFPLLALAVVAPGARTTASRKRVEEPQRWTAICYYDDGMIVVVAAAAVVVVVGRVDSSIVVAADKGGWVDR